MEGSQHRQNKGANVIKWFGFLLIVSVSLAVSIQAGFHAAPAPLILYTGSIIFVVGHLLD